MNRKKIGSKDLQIYVGGKKVLIAEPSVPISTVIHQTMMAMGCLPENIYKETSLERAKKLLIARKPEIVISEYHLGEQFGLELAEIQATLIENPIDRIFILVTGNSADSAIAEAAEEEIDGYILKPFNLNQLQDAFLQVMAKKMNPGDYMVSILSGKELIKAGQFAEAQGILAKAKKLDSKPSLACYYEGLALKGLKKPSDALSSFKEGQKHNPIHYKCMQGEFDLLLEGQNRKEAYEVIKKINKNYPVSPQTLEKMFLLAVYTQNYDDIGQYYEIFTKLDRRNDELLKVASAALYSAARYSLQNSDFVKAEDLFKKCINVAQRDRALIHKVCQLYVKLKRMEDAEKFLALFNPDDRETAEFSQIEFEVYRTGQPDHKVIEKGKKVISLGHANPEIYRSVVTLLVKMNKVTSAEEIIFKSGQDFPELKKELYLLIENKN